MFPESRGLADWSCAALGGLPEPVPSGRCWRVRSFTRAFGGQAVDIRRQTGGLHQRAPAILLKLFDFGVESGLWKSCSVHTLKGGQAPYRARFVSVAP